MEKFTKEEVIAALEVVLKFTKDNAGTDRGRIYGDLDWVSQIIAEHQQELKDEKPLGTVHGPDRPFMCMSTSVGEAKNPESGQTFDLSSTLTGTPIVICRETNNMFILDWNTILNLAIQADIGKPLSP